MTTERGDILVATDPFKDDDTTGCPFLILNRTETPFHGEQYITCSLRRGRGMTTESLSQMQIGWKVALPSRVR